MTHPQQSIVASEWANSQYMCPQPPSFSTYHPHPFPGHFFTTFLKRSSFVRLTSASGWLSSYRSQLYPSCHTILCRKQLRPLHFLHTDRFSSLYWCRNGSNGLGGGKSFAL
jgi:hypothetical protein